MKKIDISSYLPMGFPVKPEKRIYLWSYGLAFLNSLRFLLRYTDELSNLRRAIRRNHPFTMPTFGSLLADLHPGLGFLLAALAILSCGLWHYTYHYQGSKSIYLMRRLPNRRELLRRCLPLPLLGAALALLLGILTLALFYILYMTATPKAYLPPDIWSRHIYY